MNRDRIISRLTALAGLLLSVTAAGASDPVHSSDWIERSDAHTQVVTELFASYFPELLGGFGVEGIDEEILQISFARDARAKREMAALRDKLQGELDTEADSAVRQDLEILTGLLARELELAEAEERLLLPYFDVAETIFRGLRGLLDAQVPIERRRAALVRLERYAGREAGYSPLTEQAEAFSRQRFATAGLLGPFIDEVEKDLARAPRLVDGIGQLFEAHGVDGYQEAYAELRAQLLEYQEFVRREILPRTRDDFRLPSELYALQLADLGVDMPVEELTSRAKVAFREIQNEMQALATLLAAERGLATTDYRAVLAELRTQQLTADSIIDFYMARISDIETIIEREQVVALPERPLRLRLATAAEEAIIQAATIRWPQLLGEAAEVGEIILPVRRPATDADGEKQIDDFTFAAAAWSLIVHEGRPGHELQMASMLERGVSKARAFYALNSTNVEGWALYAEAEMKPYLPLDAQLVSLQHRLLRAARAFLDPGLQRGEITEAQAMRVLMTDVVISRALAEQEVERYMSRSPGQATSYFCGYSRLLELRADAERLLGEAFDRAAFNDLVLDQGLLPPALLRRAVMDELLGASGMP